MASFHFSARTLEPWDVVHQGFKTATGLGIWLKRITGDDITYTDLEPVREWLKGARADDVIYLDSDYFQPVARELADIEIRCNKPVNV